MRASGKKVIQAFLHTSYRQVWNQDTEVAVYVRRELQVAFNHIDIMSFGLWIRGYTISLYIHVYVIDLQSFDSRLVEDVRVL